MNKAQSQQRSFSVGARVAHLLIALSLLILLPTGFKLLSFNHPEAADWFGPLIEKLSISGAVLSLHVATGKMFASFVLFYLCYLVLSGEARFLLLSRRDGFIRRLLNSGLLIVLLAITITGLALAEMIRTTVPYEQLVVWHRSSVFGLLLIGIVHTLTVLLSRRMKIAALFISDSQRQTKVALPLMISFVIALLFYLFPSVYGSADLQITAKVQNRPIFLDGKRSDLEWLGVDSVAIELHGGSGLDDGRTTAYMKVRRDHRTLYFLLEWEDPSRSLNKHLYKSEAGWLLPDGPDLNIVEPYAEDMIGLTLSRNDKGCLTGCHLLPIENIGRHYTDGDTLDFWNWKAVSSNPARQAVDGYWDSNLDSLASGIHLENVAGGGTLLNFDLQWRQPYFLPRYFYVRDWIDITTDSYEPYSEELDTFSIGSTVPAVAVGPMMGDRGDVRAYAQWRGGHWTLEMARSMSTGSPLDLKLIDTLYLNLAVFDNNEKKHAYSIRPVMIIFE